MSDENELILASGSKHRARLLRAAGLEFRAMEARIDERAVEAPLLAAEVEPADIAQILARLKAEAVSRFHPEAYVIGADQTLSLDGEMLHKAKDMEDARRRLLKLSGRTHRLDTAVCIALEGETIWSHSETALVHFRDYDPGFAGRYLARVGKEALSSVGAYQIEGPGAQLVSAIEGDFFTIQGLPLLPLLAELRRRNLIDG